MEQTQQHPSSTPSSIIPILFQLIQNFIKHYKPTLIQQTNSGFCFILHSLESQKQSQAPTFFTVTFKNGTYIMQIDKDFKQTKLDVNFYRWTNEFNVKSQSSIMRASFFEEKKNLCIQASVNEKIMKEMTEFQIKYLLNKYLTDLFECIDKIPKRKQEISTQGKSTSSRKTKKDELKKEIRSNLQVLKKLIQNHQKKTQQKYNCKITCSCQPKECILGLNLRFINSENQSSLQTSKQVLQKLRLYQIEQGKEKSSLQENKENNPRIVRKIIFKEKMVDRLWDAPESGLGTIKKLQACYIVEDTSINFNTSEIIQKSLGEIEGKLEKGPIIEKTGMNVVGEGAEKIKSIQESFRTEVAVLKNLRNFYSNYIASYYLESIKRNQFPTSIFLNYYPNSLSEYRPNFKEYLKLMTQLSESIKFLKSCSTIHRDLKPGNLMVSEKSVLKVIDFGSAWVNHKTRNADISSQLRTTRYYNIQYVKSEKTQGLTQQEFEQHKHYDVYSFGKISEAVLGRVPLNFSGEKNLRIHMNWLESVCSCTNPELRVSPEVIAYFMKQIGKLFMLENPQQKCSS